MKKGIKLGFAVTVIILSIGYGVYAFSKATNIFPEEDMKFFKIFAQAFQIVKANYVESEEATSKKLVYNAIKGMLENLDAHSGFMEPEATKEMEVETKGQFGGIGIEITVRDGVLTVVAPIDDTPAAKAGILANDQIIKINGKLTKGMTVQDAVKLLRGEPKTPVTIHIMREGFKELKEVTLVRDIIKIKTVKYQPLENKFAYIRVTQFQEQTTNDFRKAFDDLKSKIEIKGLILDLRNNPGGLLDQAVKLADEFVKEGIIVYTKDRAGKGAKFMATNKEKIVGDYPIICLVNGGSASASEIVAGALQDHKIAVILGSQTFGKASVQTIFPLEDGSSLRLTTARYYTPSGKLIQAKGITPDIEFKDGSVHMIKEKDLPKHLAGDDKEDGQKNTKEEKEQKDGKKDTHPMRIPKSPEEDEMVKKAVELIKSWDIFKNRR